MSAFANLDTGFPMFNSKMNTEQKLKAMEDYLVQVLEQLRYTLNNLGADNFNESDLKTLGVEINQPVYAKIEDVDSDLRTEITATAEGVVLDVHKEYATTWVSGTAYKVNDVIKRESSNDVGFYKCKQDHTAADNNRPPTGAYWSDYWTVLQATDVLHSRFDFNVSEIRSEVSRATQAESQIDQKADSIQLQVTGSSAPEWTSGATYTKDFVVKVTTAATASTPQSITYYKAKSDHTAAAGNKPPNATYWATTTAPNVNSMIDLNLNGLTLAYDNDNIGADEHNGSYIKLMKDGTFIGGGKVFIKDLDASTIKTGVLDAANVTLRDEFSVVTTGFDDNDHTAGTIGGTCTGSALNPHYSVYLTSGSGSDYGAIDLDNRSVEIEVSKWDSVNSRTDYINFTIEHDEIIIKRRLNGVITNYNLLDLLDQI